MFHLCDIGMERVDWHYHEFHKILLFLSDHAQYAIEGKHYQLARGDILFVPQASIHRPEIVDSLPYERIILYISPDFLQAASTKDCDLQHCFTRTRENFDFVLRPPGLQEHYIQLLLALENAIHSDGFGKNVLKRALFLQFLVEVSRSMLDASVYYPHGTAYDEKALEILQYINMHLTEPISIDALSARFFLSKYHMMRRFKEATGRTIHSYISEKRLLLARDAIRSGLPVMEACERCGYQDYSAFSRAYRKLFGCSPRESYC